MSDDAALIIADAIRQVAQALLVLGLVSFLYTLAYLYRWRSKPWNRD